MDIFYRDYTGLIKRETPIHLENEYAFRLVPCNGHLELVKYLIEQGVYIYYHNKAVFSIGY